MKRGLLLLVTALACSGSVADSEFEMTLLDSFVISGRGFVVSGRVNQGSLSVGDVVCLHRNAKGTEREVTVSGIERRRKPVDRVSARDLVALQFEGVEKGDAEKGDSLTAECQEQ